MPIKIENLNRLKNMKSFLQMCIDNNCLKIYAKTSVPMNQLKNNTNMCLSTTCLIITSEPLLTSREITNNISIKNLQDILNENILDEIVQINDTIEGIVLKNYPKLNNFINPQNSTTVGMSLIDLLVIIKEELIPLKTIFETQPTIYKELSNICH